MDFIHKKKETPEGTGEKRSVAAELLAYLHDIVYILALILLLAITIGWLYIYSKNYTIPPQAESIENDTGLIQAHGRTLYDANGKAVTSVYNVSVEAYGKAQLSGANKDVVIAMMRYGDSVAAL